MLDGGGVTIALDVEIAEHELLDLGEARQGAEHRGVRCPSNGHAAQIGGMSEGQKQVRAEVSMVQTARAELEGKDLERAGNFGAELHHVWTDMAVNGPLCAGRRVVRVHLPR